jgi:hypothetical protein
VFAGMTVPGSLSRSRFGLRRSALTFSDCTLRRHHRACPGDSDP